MSSKTPSRTSSVAIVAAALAACASRETPVTSRPPVTASNAPSRSRAPVGRVETVSTPRRSTHAYGRAGDLVLIGATGARITVAATPNVPGHRPLRGAILDLDLDATDRSDPLLWWLPGVYESSNSFHAISATTVEAMQCDGGDAGIRVIGSYNGITLRRVVCALPDGRFSVTTQSENPLPAGTRIAADLVVGTSPAVIDRLGMTWEDEQNTGWVALAEHGIAGLITSSAPMHVKRRPIRIASEVFPAPVTVVHDESTVSQILDVRAGDALDAIAAVPSADRHVTVTLPADRHASLALLDDADHPLVIGDLGSEATRTLTFPSGFGSALRARDDRGLNTRVAIPAGNTVSVTVPPVPAASLRLAFRNTDRSALPVHVLFRGLNGTADPEPAIALPSRAAGRSVYLADGTGEVSLPPGRYQVTATHGFTYSLSVHEINVADGAHETLEDTLREVVDTHDWVSGDFHLHAAPSPDSIVSLEARVLSLVCEGVDLAVATDHNRISDYAPAVHSLGYDSRIDTVPGNEITPSARLWGHFNAYPLAVPTVAPEDAVSIYYDTTPAAIFASARESGARILQVNHPRMPPSIGYFDLTQFDARTGRGNEFFSDRFDAVEAFNGIWLETPAKVREGLQDLIGLVRAGMRPTAMGNSDSHTLLYEEAGYPRTFVHTPSLPVNTRGARVVDALGHGDTTLSSGPFVEMRVGNSNPGTTVRAPRNGRVRVHVRVRAPAWVPVEHVEVWVDDIVAQRIAIPGPARDGVRFERDIDVTVNADAVISAWADAETPLPDVLPYPQARAIGFTGLLYVDRDGDGQIHVPASSSSAPPPSSSSPPPAHHH